MASLNERPPRGRSENASSADIPCSPARWRMGQGEGGGGEFGQRTFRGSAFQLMDGSTPPTRQRAGG